MRRYLSSLSLLLCCIAPALAIAAEPAADSASALLGVMYWTDRNAGIYRAARDGSEMQLVVPRAIIDSIAVDREGKKLYWMQITNRGLQHVQLWRSELDGSLPALLAEDFNWTGDVVFDPVDKHLYVSSLGDGKITRLKADGTDRKDFLAGLPPPSRLHLDVKNRKLYWASNSQPTIDRINLDGTGRETVLEKLPGVAYGFSIDPMEQKIYWTTPLGALHCSKLDGSERRQLFGGLSHPDGLAIDVENRKLYWSEVGKLSQANLDGSMQETLVSDKSNLYSSVEILPPAE